MNQVENHVQRLDIPRISKPKVQQKVYDDERKLFLDCFGEDVFRDKRNKRVKTNWGRKIFPQVIICPEKDVFTKVLKTVVELQISKIEIFNYA